MYRVLPHIYAGNKYIFNRFFGFTYSISEDTDKSSTDDCISNDLKYAMNPFLLKKREKSHYPEPTRIAKCYAKMLVWLWKYCYPLIYIISHLRLPIYEDAGTANLVFRNIFNNKNQRILCLPRSIFIATTSKRFREHGTMFIGCFFPSRHMHAWVIEDGMQADLYDDRWILFTPLAMMK